VWSKDGAYRPERGTLRSFLIVCVRNEALSHKRSAVRRTGGDSFGTLNLAA